MNDMSSMAQNQKAPMKPTPSIDDVARAAGVSTKTVSRVINREPNVTPSTRERVLNAIEALSYTPSVSARVLAGNRSYQITLFCSSPRSDYFADIQFAAMSVCQASGYRLMVTLLKDYPYKNEIEAEKTLAALIGRPFPDSILLPPPFCDDPHILTFLKGRNVPYVRISPKDDDDSPFVSFNEEDAAFEITSHLIALGHEEIAFVRGDEGHSATTAREKGFRRAFAKNDLRVREDLIYPGTFLFPSGVEAGEKMFIGDAAPTAVFACNDEMAAGVSIAAHRAGLDIPDDVSIVGFDDSSVAQLTLPPLTTVKQPLERLAAIATEIAIGQHSKHADPEKETTTVDSYDLIIRSSTARPRAS